MLLDRSNETSFFSQDWNLEATSAAAPQIPEGKIQVQQPSVITTTDQMPDNT